MNNKQESISLSKASASLTTNKINSCYYLQIPIPPSAIPITKSVKF